MSGAPYTELDLARCALITIDTQCDVLEGAPLEIPGTSAALPTMAALAQAFRDTRRPIVHVVRIYEPDGSNVDLCRRELVESGAAILATGAPGTEIAPALLPAGAPALDAARLLGGGLQEIGPEEVVVYKPRWGAFFQTPLHEHLRSLGVSTLVFCGCNFPNCPRTSIYEASERDYRVALARDAISGLYERGERELAGIGVQLLGTDELVAALSAQSATPA